MTRVDFYIVSDKNAKSEDLIACRLAEKAIMKDYRILLLAADDAQLRILDEKLWTYKDQAFLPHEVVESDIDSQSKLAAGKIKLYLSTTEQNSPEINLLINLSGRVPSNSLSFERIAEIVPANPAARGQSRARFKQYRARNRELLTHEL